jgi:hypothetical protein
MSPDWEDEFLKHLAAFIIFIQGGKSSIYVASQVGKMKSMLNEVSNEYTEQYHERLDKMRAEVSLENDLDEIKKKWGLK